MSKLKGLIATTTRALGENVIEVNARVTLLQRTGMLRWGGSGYDDEPERELFDAATLIASVAASGPVADTVRATTTLLSAERCYGGGLLDALDASHPMDDARTFGEALTALLRMLIEAPDTTEEDLEPFISLYRIDDFHFEVDMRASGFEVTYSSDRESEEQRRSSFYDVDPRELSEIVRCLRGVVGRGGEAEQPPAPLIEAEPPRLSA